MPTELMQAPESLFWYWIAERHAIYLRRSRGEAKPWTKDPILRDYKFTNPFRENDRGTVWLRENFLTPHREVEHETVCRDLDKPCQCGADFRNLQLLAFNIAWYRMFNWTGTGEALGWQTDWNEAEIIAKLNARLAAGQQVFTGAHIVYSPPGEGKIESIVKVCGELYRLCTRTSDVFLSLPRIARKFRSLERVFDELQTIHCVGGFMGYEMVTDMRHTRLLEDATDIMTWANPGPGARRGLQRLGMKYKGDAAIDSMRELLSHKAFKPVSLQDQVSAPEWTCQTCGNDGGFCGCKVPLEMRDIEHSLCEFDKYCRVKFGEGKPRSMFNGAA